MHLSSERLSDLSGSGARVGRVIAARLGVGVGVGLRLGTLQV